MMSNTCKRFISLMMALILVVALLPVGAITVSAESTVSDAAIFFSDLHADSSNYKESIVKGVFSKIANDGLNVTSVTSVGGAFVEEVDSTSAYNADKITGYIHDALNSSTIPVYYAWSDHDRYAKVGGNDLDSESGFIYGVGDSDANYYIYELSMADLSTNDCYNTGLFSDAEEVAEVIEDFKETAEGLDKTKPLFIVSHMPLLDRRDDNGHAYAWATAINEVADNMDVIFLHGHNHDCEQSGEFVRYKNTTINVCSDSSGNSQAITLNFTHMSAGYLDPTTTSAAARRGTAVVLEIVSDYVYLTTYTEDGVFSNGAGALLTSVKRDHGHTHVYNTETVNATCTTPGSITKTCTICNITKTEVIAAPGHQFETVVTDPTCTENGFTTYTCTVCNYSEEKDIIDALGHKYQETSTASCTQPGVKVFTCEVCKDSYEGDSVAALGHSYSSTVVAPTCDAAGYTVHVCANCGDTYQDSEVAALGHNYKSKVTAPTCTAGGFTTYTCETCGGSYQADEVAATGHDYESVVTPPTTESEGYTTNTCKVCGDVTVTDRVPVLSHTYEAVTVEATCIEDGSVTYTCTKCGDSYIEAIPATGHNFTEYRFEPTCTEDGSIITACANCGAANVNILPATGHTLETTTVEATCTTVGYTTVACACGYSDTTIIPMKDHAYTVDSKKEASCTSIGYTTYVCADCSKRKTDDYISALGHSYQTEAVNPTCTDKGYTLYTCDTCGESYKENYINATGHTYNEVVTAPTCTETGYSTYTCSSCGKVTTGNYVAATGHRFDCVESGNQLIYSCKLCDYTYSETAEPDFIYTKASRLESDESYVITLYTNKQYYALSHKDNRISAVPVTVANNRITSEVTEDLIWNYNDNVLSYTDNGITRSLKASSTKLSVSISDSSSVVYSGSKLKVGTNYLRYASNTVTLNRTATTAYLFVQNNA